MIAERLKYRPSSLAYWEKSIAHTARKTSAIEISNIAYGPEWIHSPQARRHLKLLGISRIYLDGYGSFPWFFQAKVGDGFEDRDAVLV
jgi:hypothetical protein